MFSQKEMQRCISHAIKNPIVSRGRTSISRMAALITDYKYEHYEGWNKYKTHPLMFKFSKDHNKICLHAEIDALIRVITETGSFSSLGNKDIYIARVLKDNSPALAKPCSCCLGALQYFGIHNIYHT